MHDADRDVQDTTAVNDVDSGLQMAVSPCSALSASSVISAMSNDPQHRSKLVITRTGVGKPSGV